MKEDACDPPINWCDPAERQRHQAAFASWVAGFPDLDGVALPPEGLSSPVMRRLMRLGEDNPDTVVLVLAAGCMHAWMGAATVRTRLCELARVLQIVRSRCGVAALADLRERAVWDCYVNNVEAQSHIKYLQIYDQVSRVYMPGWLACLPAAERAHWARRILPPLPPGFIRRAGSYRAHAHAAQARRRGRVEPLVHALPYLLQLSAARVREGREFYAAYLAGRARAEAGEALPLDIRYDATLHALDPEHVRPIGRAVAVRLTLWDRPSWMRAHPHRRAQGAAGRDRALGGGRDPGYLVQPHGEPADLPWFAPIFAAGAVGMIREDSPARRRAAGQSLGVPAGWYTSRPGLLNPAQPLATWLLAHTGPDDVLIEPEGVYDAVLMGAALATMAMTAAPRVGELEQIALEHWEPQPVPVCDAAGVPTGRQTTLPVQMLIPKGRSATSRREPYLICAEARSLLYEIQDRLARAYTPAGTDPDHANIPRVRPGVRKAGMLPDRRYLFQYGACAGTSRLGLVDRCDMNKLVRFILAGVRLATAAGEEIEINIHLLRHVVGTYARQVARLPGAAVQAGLHHAGERHGHGGLPAITAYYTQMPMEQALAILDGLQRRLFVAGAAPAGMPDTAARGGGGRGIGI